MTVTPEVLYVVMVVIAVNLALLGLVTSCMNLQRSFRGRRSAKHVAEIRPRVLELLEDDATPELVLNRSERVAFVTVARGLLPGLRGSEVGRLTALLEATGCIAAAFGEVHSRFALRRARAADLLGSAAVRRAVPELVRLLDDRSVDVRQTAAHALGVIGDASAVPALLHVIETGRVPLNTTSMALLRIGPDARSALATGLRSGGERVRAICAELLGLLVAISALPELTAAASSDPSLEVRIRAIRALGTIGVPSSVDVIAAAAEGDQPAGLRAVATRAVGRIGGPRTLSWLLGALNGPEHVVAANAAEALSTIADGGEAALSSAARDATTLKGQYAREGLAQIALGRSRREAMT